MKKFLDGNDTVYIFDFEKELINSINKADNIFTLLLAGYKIVQYQPYSAEETVQRARSCIGKENYNVFLHNCEHFAIWCKTGIENSTQIEEIISVVVGAVVKK